MIVRYEEVGIENRQNLNIGLCPFPIVTRESYETASHLNHGVWTALCGRVRPISESESKSESETSCRLRRQ